MEVNNPDVLLYSTKASYRDGDAFSSGYRMQLDWLPTLEPHALALEYFEPGYWGRLRNSLGESMVVYLDTAPDLRAPRDPSEQGAIRIRIYDTDSANDTGVLDRATLMSFETRNPEGEWHSRLSGSITWQDNYATNLIQCYVIIPDSLLGSSPYFGWKLIRTRLSDSASAPSVPTLFLRDEAEFRRRVY